MRIVKKSIIGIISLAAFLLFTPLEIVNSLWSRFVLGQNTAISSGFMREAYAMMLSTVEDALNALMPEAQQVKKEIKGLTEEQQKAVEAASDIKFDAELDKEYNIYIGSLNSQIIGYAIEDTVKGKWGPIHYIVYLDPNGKIMDIMVLEYMERRGKPVAERRFLDQFINKTSDDQIRLKRDIKGVAGATVSSRGMSDGIRKIAHIFNELYKK